MKGSAKALKSGRKYIWSILKWILMLAFAIYTLFPLLWLFITSFKTNAEYFDSPFSLPAVPQFSKVGLLDSLNALRILYAAIGIPISTFIIRGFMDSFPVEIEEAAYVDGCGFFGRFFKIVLPLTKTGLVTAATFQFLTCWNEFVYANLLTSSPATKTIQIGIRYFTNQFTTDYVSMYAAIVIAIVPSIVIYMLFQEQVISGLTAGAVKG